MQGSQKWSGVYNDEDYLYPNLSSTTRRAKDKRSLKRLEKEKYFQKCQEVRYGQGFYKDEDYLYPSLSSRIRKAEDQMSQKFVFFGVKEQ